MGLRICVLSRFFFLFFPVVVELTLLPAFSLTAESGSLCGSRVTHVLCAPKLPCCWSRVPKPQASYFQRNRAIFGIQGEVLSYEKCVFDETLRNLRLQSSLVNPLVFLLTRSRASCAASAVGEGQAFLCPQGSHSGAHHQVSTPETE